MRDETIGRRLLELEALLYAGVKSFVLVQGQLKDAENARIIIGHYQKCCEWLQIITSHSSLELPKAATVVWLLCGRQG